MRLQTAITLTLLAGMTVWLGFAARWFVAEWRDAFRKEAPSCTRRRA